MMEAPVLTLPEVRQEVERIFRRDHRSRLVALFGRGEAADFDLDATRWTVVPTRCELDLRERLPAPDATVKGGRVFLVDWTPDVLPLDVGCRLAGGRLYHVARDARLAAIFGARQVAPGLPGSALAKLYLSGGAPQPRKVQGLQVGHREAWTSLLEGRLRLPEAALSSPGALLGWAATSDGGPAFVRLAEGDDLWRNVRRELHEWLRSTVGDAALVVWHAWEAGLAPRLLEVTPLLAAARAGGEATKLLGAQLAGQLAAWFSGLASAVRSAEPVLADEGNLAAALPTERGRLLATLERSQSLADAAELGGLTAASDRLPGGHRARERQLAQAVQSFLAQPVSERGRAVVEALERLEAHRVDAQLRADDHRSARRNLGRVALWLAARETGAPGGARWQPAVDLARRYAEEGGYLEWARQQLRGLRGADAALLAAAQELERAAGEARRHEHQAFAEAYVRWVEAGKPSAHAIPIEDVGKHVIAPFLRGNGRRRLLVVLMDGMSYAAAVQVIARLTTARRWGLVAWRRDGWGGVLPLPPVLAAAPTLTEISRGAFFAGKADARLGDEGTDKDPARWASHRALAEVVGEGAPPLFVRRDILSGHDLASDVREAIKGECRAVAVVVNAVDEDLKGSVQVAKDYSLAPILPLDALLSAAEEGERAVLLVADHGHVLGDGAHTLEGRMGRGRPGGARWRALAEGEAPAPEEVALPKGSWVPRGWERVAALWEPAVVNRSPSYGEHGGLSLAEAVAPAFLIAPDWLERAVPDDPELAVRVFPTPDWWELRARESVERPVERAPLSSGEHVQEELFVLARRVAPGLARVSPFVSALQRSPVFRGQTGGLAAGELERVIAWLSALVEAGGAMPADAFAAAAGCRAHQVAGVVARMGVLNADGFAMVEHDHVGRRVLLHRARLAQHYGVKE